MAIQSKRNRKSHRRRNKSRSKATSFSPPRVGPAFDKLVAVMNRLRAPGGCPWDREQTHTTLRTYLVEEAYEVLDALDSADDAKFAEELGDLLLQVLFHRRRDPRNLRKNDPPPPPRLRRKARQRRRRGPPQLGNHQTTGAAIQGGCRGAELQLRDHRRNRTAGFCPGGTAFGPRRRPAHSSRPPRSPSTDPQSRPHRLRLELD